MKRFDFDALTERRNTGSMKWDTLPADDIIPLWVADMDFRTAPVVTEALRRRVDAGIFGYTDIPSSYYDAVCGWFSRRHGWYIDREMMIVTSGVVPAISAVIKALTIPGDGVILQTPAYNCFFSSVRNNGCREYDNRLVRISEGAGFSYEMDFENLENLASDPRNKLLILCNPHNPTGRVWTRSELERVRDICRRHRVRVVSDEIHCELTHPGFDYIPYATVDDHAVVCGSPSKAFNIAGLQNAFIVSPTEEVRDKIDRAINDNEVCDVNPFGVDAVTAAYEAGEEWLEALRSYLDDNNRLLQTFIERRLPSWKMCLSESTYLAWVDITATGIDGDRMERLLLEQAKVKVSSGAIYGAPDFIRINYATPRARLEEALERIAAILQ
ncbi:MAG: pyridoxal phosphate-dependent aminotransferase [Muribaculaceae bacterium]|nr:pyridoxal phosphate-dependent aminotransferase [Muribaculaceae bacterium]